jgi:hypothetical protein
MNYDYLVAQFWQKANAREAIGGYKLVFVLESGSP